MGACREVGMGVCGGGACHDVGRRSEIASDLGVGALRVRLPSKVDRGYLSIHEASWAGRATDGGREGRDGVKVSFTHSCKGIY